MRPYIDRAGQRAAPPAFVWDEDRPHPFYEPVDEIEQLRMETLTRRANCGLCIGIAEWVVARFDGLPELVGDDEPAQLLEAAWLANIDLRYAAPVRLPPGRWRGPVRGPIALALGFAQDALLGGVVPAEIGDPVNGGESAARAARFARHVLPARQAFDDWLAFCLERLERHFIAPPDEPEDGEPRCLQHIGTELVLPPAFDPDRLFDPQQSVFHAARLLAAADPSRNPYLADVAMLRARGFEGQPYRFPPR